MVYLVLLQYHWVGHQMTEDNHLVRGGFGLAMLAEKLMIHTENIVHKYTNEAHIFLKLLLYINEERGGIGTILGHHF